MYGLIYTSLKALHSIIVKWMSHGEKHSMLTSEELYNGHACNHDMQIVIIQAK